MLEDIMMKIEMHYGLRLMHYERTTLLGWTEILHERVLLHFQMQLIISIGIVSEVTMEAKFKQWRNKNLVSSITSQPKTLTNTS